MQRLIHCIIAIILAAVGFVLAYYLILPLLAGASFAVRTAALISAPVLFGLLGFAFAPRIHKLIARFTEFCIARLAAIPIRNAVFAILGLILGLIIAALISTVLSRIGFVGSYVAVALMVFFAYVGGVIGYRKADDIIGLFRGHLRTERTEKAEKTEKAAKKEAAAGKICPKLLDTSVIIDARIADIYRTGFIEGELIIPGFVLEELRHIADSSDTLKRNRGRRGLDILNKMRSEFGDQVRINITDYPDIAEVDSKLLKMAQEMHAVVLTNDFNLNKVARFQGVKVLNINELSNAVKPVVLPGEEMVISIVKAGKEHNQGVAYLDDGTMIVVENGLACMDKTIYVIVTSVLQTAAGKMIFARPKLRENGSVWEYEEEREA